MDNARKENMNDEKESKRATEQKTSDNMENGRKKNMNDGKESETGN